VKKTLQTSQVIKHVSAFIAVQDHFSICILNISVMSQGWGLQPPPHPKNWGSSVFWAMTKIWAEGAFGVSNIAPIHVERA